METALMSINFYWSMLKDLLIPLLVVAALIVGLILNRTLRERSIPAHVCKSCGIVGRPEEVTPGSLIMEIGLWLTFLIPGICYSIYRFASKYLACPACKNREIIPVDSPIGARIIAESSLNNSKTPDPNVVPNWPPKAVREGSPQ